MDFKKYQHIERFGTDEVDGIEFGECLIFYKIDGTNGSVWLEEIVKAGSRNRELTLEKDNQGFYNYIIADKRIEDYLHKHPTHRLFGEWLTKHSLKTYRDNAWRKFYIFDVCLDKEEDDSLEYIPYDIYQPLLEEFDLDYIPPLAKIRNPTYDSLVKLLDKTGQFLIKNGAGQGEGIVIKNYDFYNKWSRQTWAKMVLNEFKEKQHKEMGAPLVLAEKMIEEDIIDDFLTTAFIEKEYAKIVNEKEGWRSQYIPMLFGKVYYELVNEEIWNIVKKYEKPKVDFKRLYSLVVNKIKQIKPNIFA
jgi:hypothetical protein